MVATHLREVHYWLAIACDLCKSFTSMSAQSILEHCSGCKVKCAIEYTEQDMRCISHTRSPRCEGRKKPPEVSSGSTDKVKL